MALVIVAISALVLIGLGAGSAKAATLEQVATFAGILEAPIPPGKYPEEVQMGGVSGMAVNVTGAGGVPAGTVYVATYESAGEFWVSRFAPDGEFEFAWKPTAVESETLQRCGPPGGAEVLPACSPRPGEGPRSVDVDVDQETGNVYVLRTQAVQAEALAVTIYNPNGTEVLSRFGELSDAEGKTTAETPAEIHSSPYPGGLAVGKDGKVYVFDFNFSDNKYHRLMVFEPQSPGDITHYVYAGQAHDVAAAFGFNALPQGPVTDAAGNVYVAGYQGVYIEEYDPSQPATPTCALTVPGAGITSMTVNRATGEVFYYASNKKQVQQLSKCQEGTFTPLGPAVSVSPKRDDLYAMAFNPALSFSAGRPPGVLYGGAPSAVPSTSGSGQPGRGALGYMFAPTKESPPVIVSQAVSNVGTTSAELHAQINPQGIETRYRFQFVTNAAFDEAGGTFDTAEEAPLNGGSVGSSQAPLPVASSLSNLLPDTEYHYRVLASNCAEGKAEEACEAAGSGQTFRTYPTGSAALPDGRAYELVSPPIKNGGQVLPAYPDERSCLPAQCKPGVGLRHFPMESTAEGNAVVYEGTKIPLAAEGAVIENQYRAQRTPSGWVSSNLTPALLQSKERFGGYQAFDPLLERSVVAQPNVTLAATAPSGYTNLYAQESATPLALEPLLTEGNATIHRSPGSGTGSLSVIYAGSSEDLSRVFFEANDALTAEAVDGGETKRNLYEWSAGQLRLVNFAPGNGETIIGAEFGSGTLLKSGNVNTPNAVLNHAVSEDGSRAFWTGEDGKTYMRVGGAETVEVPSPGNCKATVAVSLRVCFLTASLNGSMTLLSNGQLFELNEAGTAFDLVADLSGGAGGFEGMVGQSFDLSHIYFVHSAVLTGEEENPSGAKAEAGKDNLYAWVNGKTSFIGTLVPTDDPGLTGTWHASAPLRAAEASPGGRYLAFLSRARLTGANTVGPCGFSLGEYVTLPCPEAYLYDSSTGRLICASCSSSGVPPLGLTALRLIEGAEGSKAQPRYLTNSGRLYFDTRNSLVPGDTNGSTEDVYQYEPDGVGDCTRSGGCVALISTGRGLSDSNLVTIDEGGENVFFTTRERIVPADQDELIDLYDARVGGGFPSEAQAPPAQCEGEGCQSVVPNPPPPPPPSSTLPTPKKLSCKPGQVRRNGHCVKKPKSKKKHKKAKQERGKTKSGGRAR